MSVDAIKEIEPTRILPAEFHFNDTEPLPETKVEPVFGIRIGNLGFLVTTSLYCEVLDKVAVNPLPNVHPWVTGILNLRGNFVPVFDLHHVLKESTTDHQKRRLFAIDRGERAVAVWIDNFPEIKDKAAFTSNAEVPLLPPVVQRSVRYCYGEGNQIWLDIKFDELFSALGRHQTATEEMAR